MLKITSDTEVWKHTTSSLTVYRNSLKIDDLLGRVWGQLISSIERQEGKGQKRQGKLLAKLGGLASLLGIGEVGAEYGFERSKDEINKQISTLTYDNKVQILLKYYEDYDQLRYLNFYDGVEHVRPKVSGETFQLWKVKPLNVVEDEIIGYASGIFLPIRRIPPPDKDTNPGKDIMERASTLWEYRSVPDSAVKATIPWIAGNFTLGSQGAIIAVMKTADSGTRINVLGLITKQDDTFLCDPLAFQILLSPKY